MIFFLNITIGMYKIKWAKEGKKYRHPHYFDYTIKFFTTNKIYER